ncbi:MAG: prolyl oligopeptidase family serine peptidase [Acidimicrobiia bacterium]
MQAPVSAAMVARSHTVAEPRWSGSGRMLAWVDAFDGRADVVLAPADGSLPAVVASADAAATPVGAYGGGALAWAGDDQLVYAAADGRLLLVGLAGGPARVLSRDGRAAAPAVSPDGTRVAFVLERDDACDVAVAPLDGSAWPVRMSEGSDYAWDPVWSPAGDLLAWHEWELPNMPWDESRIAARKVDGRAPAGEPQVVTRDGVAVSQPRFAPDGSALAFVSDETGWANIWIADPDGSRARPVLDEPHEHAEPSWGPGQRSYAWSPDAGALALCRNDDGFGHLVVALANRAPGSGAQRVASGWHQGLDWGPAGLACVRSGPATPPAITTMLAHDDPGRDLATGTVAGFAEATEPEAVTWAADDRAAIPGLLWRPAAPALGPEARPPLIVDVHGGPTGQATATWSPRHQFFLSRGWAVLAPNARGSTGYGRAYAQALRGGWGHRDLADVAAGIRHASREGWCDADRIAVMGGSAGGLTALLLAAFHGDLVRAAVSLYGVTDLFDLAETTHRFESRYLDRIVGDLPRHAGRYRERSPVTHAAAMSAPVLVLQGVADKVVPPAQARVMVDAMRDGGAPVEYHEYEGEGHGWSHADTVADALERIDGFLTRWVLRR